MDTKPRAPTAHTNTVTIGATTSEGKAHLGQIGDGLLKTDSSRGTAICFFAKYARPLTETVSEALSFAGPGASWYATLLDHHLKYSLPPS